MSGTSLEENEILKGDAELEDESMLENWKLLKDVTLFGSVAV